MRYQARWSNGYWKTFDSIRFEDVAIHFLKREADESAVKMNARSHK